MKKLLPVTSLMSQFICSRIGRSIKIEDRSGSDDPIQSTSKIEADQSLPDFYYRSLSIPLDHIDLLRVLSILFGSRILANVWLFHVAEIISHYCTNFLLVLQPKCSKFFPSKAAKVELLSVISYIFIT